MVRPLHLHVVMSSSPAPQSSMPRRELPLARITPPHSNPDRLRPLGLVPQARATLIQLGRGAFDVVRSSIGACVGVVAGGLNGAKRGCERLLWWLGYAKVDLVEAPKPRQLPPRKPHPRLIRRDPNHPIAVPAPAPAPVAAVPAPAPIAASAEDDEVTTIYNDPAVDNDEAKTSVVLRRAGTDNEVTRILPDNVIPFSPKSAG